MNTHAIGSVTGSFQDKSLLKSKLQSVCSGWRVRFVSTGWSRVLCPMFYVICVLCEFIRLETEVVKRLNSHQH